jgi:signal transduction histidine kinase
MKERIASLDGNLQINSSEAGTTIEIMIPLGPAASTETV